jgi:SAM-dependent methyltransferase
MSEWDGIRGRAAGRVMASMNADMERAAVELLDPAPDAVVVAIGVGPGLGAVQAARATPSGRMLALDPSAEMVRQTTRRVAAAGLADRVEVHAAGAEAIPLPDEGADGVISVNSIQLWSPLEEGLREVARVLRPNGRFVALLHHWAVPGKDVGGWTATVTAHCHAAGLAVALVESDRYRSGDALVLVATRAGRAPSAPSVE